MKYIRQYDEMVCGPANIATIAKFYNINISISKLAELTKSDEKGTNIYGMISALNAIGLNAEALSGSVSEFLDAVIKKEITLPCIIHTISNSTNMHYAIVEKVNKKIKICDPAIGNFKLTKEEFKEYYTGYVINITKPNSIISKSIDDKEKEIYDEIIDLFLKKKAKIFIIMLLAFATAIIGIIGTYVFEIIIDEVYHNLNIHLILFGLGILYVISMIVQIVRILLSTQLNKMIDVKFYDKFNEAIVKLPSENIKRMTTGDYLSRFSSITAIRDAISNVVMVGIMDVVIILGSALVLFLKNRYLFIVSVIFIAMNVLAAYVFKKPLFDSSRRVMEDEAICESNIKENIQGEDIIRTTNSQKYVYVKSKKQAAKLVNDTVHNNIISQLQESVTGTIDCIWLIFLLEIGYVLVKKGIITTGELITFYSLSAYFSIPIKNIISLQPVFQEGKIAYKRMNDLIHVTYENEKGESVDLSWHLIEMNSVNYRYGNNELTLKNLNLKISKGEHVAIIGKSGSGKSTIAKILTGLYLPESGEICINGKNIQNVSIEQYRNQIGYVSQENFMFADTIANNLRLGNDNITDEDMVQICKECNLHNWIEGLPLKYDTPLLENGINLSGGQKQRLAIARAILQKPQLLVLDEATSNLDLISEKVIQTMLSKLKISRVTITHRLSTIRGCDRIYVVDKGQVMEKGTYADLLNEKGFFRDFSDNL